jgi:hypothetical protein
MVNGTHLFVIFGMDASMENISVTKFGTTMEELVRYLPNNDCRYVTMVVSLKNDLKKIMFIKWSPDCAKIKKKLTFQASKNTLIEKLKTIDAEMDASELEHVEFEYILQQCNK